MTTTQRRRRRRPRRRSSRRTRRTLGWPLALGVVVAVGARSPPCCCTATATPRATTSPCTCARPAACSTATSATSSPTTASPCVNSGRAVQPDRLPVGLAAAAVAVRPPVGLRLRPAEAARGRRVLRLAGARPRHRPPARRPAAGDRRRRPSSPPRRRCSRTPTSCCPSTRTPRCVAAFIWWIDRIKPRRPLIAATHPPARRARRARRRRLQRPARVRRARRRDRSSSSSSSCSSPGAARRRCRCRGGRSPRRTPRSSASSIGFQLLLPSMLFPDNGDGPTYVLDADRRLRRRADPSSSASAGTRSSA